MRKRSTTFITAVVLAVVAAGVHAQERQGIMEGITVQGTGEVQVKPDIARLTLGVQNQATDSNQAAQENADRTQKVISAVRAAGVAEKDIQTANYSLYPRYDNRPRPEGRPGAGLQGGEPVIVGYQVSNNVNVTVRKIGDAGKVIDAAVKAGANVAGGIGFALDDPTKAREEAMRKAVADVMRKAHVMAEAAKVPDIRLVSLAEASASYPQPVYFDAMARGAVAEAATTPVAPGEQTITVNVTARFAMLPFKAPQ